MNKAYLQLGIAAVIFASGMVVQKKITAKKAGVPTAVNVTVEVNAPSIIVIQNKMNTTAAESQSTWRQGMRFIAKACSLLFSHIIFQI